MSRILISGIGGFTGRHLAARFRVDGWDVHGMGSAAEAAVDPRIHALDLCDAAAVQACVAAVQPDFVLHLAGVAFVAHGRAEDFYHVHVLGTRNLLAALAEHAPSVRNVLLASSANVYGDAAAGLLREDVCPQPRNDYAVSKLAMEHMARLWSDRLPLVMARPFNYTGPGQHLDFVIPKLVDHFRRRAAYIELGNLDVEREFNDVRFVDAAYRMLLEHAEPGVTCNVCTGRLYSLRGILAELETLTGHPMEIRVNPRFVRAREIPSLGGDPTRLHQLATAAGVALPDYPLRTTLADWLETAG